MIVSDEIDRLVREMKTRREGAAPSRRGAARTQQRGEPFILFLGAGCAKAAGVPSVETIARQVFESYSGEEELASVVAPDEAGDEGDGLVHTFYKWLDTMSSGQIYRMLHSYYENIPVPAFYQDLGVLIRAGYFDRVLTTSFDTLLEQALGGAGLQAEVGYRVNAFGVSEGYESSRRSKSVPRRRDDGEPVRIIKLHGNIAQRQMTVTPGAIEEALNSQRGTVKGELKGDMLMVGYDFECEPINEWLKVTPRRQLWWVNPTPPDSQDVDVSRWAADVYHVGGEASRPENFFNQLSMRLLRLPTLHALNKSFSDYTEADEVYEGVATAQPVISDELIEEDLRGSIRQSLALLLSLEQSAPPGLRPQNLQAQIAYQKRHIAELEDKLRGSARARGRLTELMSWAAAAVRRLAPTGVEGVVRPDTVAFLEQQREVVANECEKEQPNQQILSAALAAAVTLLERLNVESEGTVVTPELLQELSGYAPGVQTRGGV